jgi:hypothetical protein
MTLAANRLSLEAIEDLIEAGAARSYRVWTARAWAAVLWILYFHPIHTAIYRAGQVKAPLSSL